MKWMLMPLRRYADFNGRSRRKEFWLWQLFNVLFQLLLWIPLIFLAFSAVQRVDDRGGVYSSSYSSSYSDRGYDDEDRYSGSGRSGRSYGYSSSSSVEVDPEMFVEEFSPIGWVLLGLSILWSLFAFIPNLAVTIRRLHDTDKSGWFILLGLIPLVGAIVLLVFYFMDGTRGPNRFGPDPKGEGHSQTFS
ncbi:MAG TPA: DUF805 domain-containing protein [Allosphingosinicella sp.]|jgi:uncharacterized membrane protein YhaH (DUF805 family)